VKFLIKKEADKLGGKAKKILYRILSQPISPELLPSREGEIVQKTEEKIGPYVLHDFFLYNFVRMGYSMEKVRFLAETVYKEKYSKEEIEKWLKLFTERFFKNQWKRDCVPGGPKVGSVDLSPRSSWRMPSEVDFKAFLY
jgi:NAD+ synthase (glutamine-hydrolysing)